MNSTYKCTWFRSVGLAVVVFSTATFANGFGRVGTDIRLRSGPQQSSQTVDVQLEDGKPVERILAGGQSHSYKVNVEAGQYLLVNVDQRGIDVVATLFGSDGKVLTAIDSPNGSHGVEPVHILSEAAGVFRIEVASFTEEALPGRYEISIAVRRQSTKADRDRQAAQRIFDEAEELVNTGLRDSIRRATAKYQESLATYILIGDQNDQYKLLLGLGNAYLEINDYNSALDAFDHALQIGRKLDDRFRQARALQRTGVTYRSMSDLDSSLKASTAALGLFHLSGDEINEAYMSTYVGETLNILGEHERARDYLNRALAMYQKLGDRREEAAILESISYSYDLQENNEKSLEYLKRSLAVATKIENRQIIARLEAFIANVNASAGNREAAIENISLALQNADRSKGLEPVSMSNIGIAYYKLGDYDKALSNLNVPLERFRSIGSKRSEAITLRHIALVLRDQGKTGEALAAMERSIALLEFLRDHAGTPETQASFVATLFHFYGEYIDLKMRLHYADATAGNAEAAFEFAEKVKVRSLVDLLRRARVDARQGIAPELISREADLNARLTDSLDGLAKLERTKATAEQKSSFTGSVSDLQNSLNEVQTKIRDSSPGFANLTEPRRLSVSDIQKQLLDENTVLIEYELGEQSYMWMVTNDGLKSFRLPRQPVIEELTRRVYDLLTTRQTANAAGKRGRAENAEAELLSASQKLSDMLLGPAASFLGTKRLLIVADGVLNYIPFAVLPVPGGRNPSYKPMLIDHEIVTLPSASVLAVLRQEFGERKPAPLTVAVIGDPVYSADDARVVPPLDKTPKAKVSEGLAEFSRLLFSRDEANAILSVTPPTSSLKVLDFDANRQFAMGGELGKYRIVHFSTHGFLDSHRPELSGIVLSQVTRRGEPAEGSLRLHEVYNMKLAADLVVLSGCQTGLGKDIRGEGLVGITRGFMYAGARRVVASLWQIDDAATAELMRRFYLGMFQRNMSPASALRSAQIEMFNKRQWRSPYFWGAFVLQGEWK